MKSFFLVVAVCLFAGLEAVAQQDEYPSISTSIETP